MRAAAVLTWVGEPRGLDACMSSLLDQTLPLAAVVCVDGNEEPGSERRSVLRGAGRAVGRHGAEVLLFTNVDCVVPPDWAERHLAWHARGFRLVSGSRVNADPVGACWNAPHDGKPSRAQRPGLGFTGSNCSVAAADLAVGFGSLDRCWDAALALRAARAGVPIVIDPSIRVRHLHPFAGALDSARHAREVGRWTREQVLAEGRAGTSARGLLPELFGLGAVRAWRQFPECRAAGLPRFALRRLLTFAGRALGDLEGYGAFMRRAFGEAGA